MNETKKVEKKREKRRKKEMIILLSLSLLLSISFLTSPFHFALPVAPFSSLLFFALKNDGEGGFFLLSELRKWGFPVKIGWSGA